MTLEQDFRTACDAGDAEAIERLGALIDAEDAATKDRLNQPGALQAAALYYARRGWPVFPCRPGGKIPGIANPHPEGSAERRTCRGECGLDGHGLYDASTDETKIRAWWTRNPAFNIGLPTGRQFDVIDIDGAQGMESLVRWTREVTLPPRIGSVLTPRRPGTHIYINPTGAGNKTAMGGTIPGIDWRGLGGYVCAPPSKTEHGMYVWAQPVAP